MNLPDGVLEQVFVYLNWNDRARAARVCRRWLTAFRSPSLWRTIVFTPPTRRMTRLQYDMKGYRLSCCLRTIGSYVQNYRFPETEDMFLLNRTLSLVASFLESTPKTPFRQTVSSDSIEEEEKPVATSVEDVCTSLSGVSYPPCDSIESDYMRGQAMRLADYIDHVVGDPDAEATLKLVLKLQEKEFFGSNSEISSDEDEVNLSCLLDDLRSASVSIPKPDVGTVMPPRGRPYQRSQSCREVQSSPAHFQNPPCIRTFILHFHCEIDESRGFIYGTGGALFATIRRVLRQLTCVRRLWLTNLFLSSVDARNLILDIHRTAAGSLNNFNLLHLNKLTPDLGLHVNSPSHCHHVISPTGDNDWYLLDPRWLGARPRRLGENPLADLASLFPHLTRLTLAPSQLSGPMLLRLLYQTHLRELILVETDLTPFVLHPVSPTNGGNQGRSASGHAGEFFRFGSRDLDGMAPYISDPEEDLIDWSEDVPCYTGIGLQGSSPSAVGSIKWHPISPAVWRAALILRPQLIVQLRFHFVRTLNDFSTSYSSSGYPFSELLSLLPHRTCPVSVMVVRATRGPQFVASLLSFSNPVNMGDYSSTLTTLVISIENVASDHASAWRLKPFSDVVAESADLNVILCELPILCSHLRVVALGGRVPYLSILTLLIMCRHYGRRTSLPCPPCDITPKIFVQEECCRLENNPIVNNTPATVTAWYSTINAVGDDPEKRRAAAQLCVADALRLSHWYFLRAAQFQSELSTYLD